MGGCTTSSPVRSQRMLEKKKGNKILSQKNFLDLICHTTMHLHK